MAEDGDLVFLHGFQHRGLRVCRRAVDFVGKHDVCEDGPFDEFELAFSADAGFLDDVGAGDVRGHQVRRELDAVEGEVEGLGYRGNEQGLGEAGNTHEQRVTAGEKADGESLDDLVLTDDDLSELGAKFLIGFA